MVLLHHRRELAHLGVLALGEREVGVEDVGVIGGDHDGGDLGVGGTGSRRGRFGFAPPAGGGREHKENGGEQALH
ncbi:hypothetical protein D3C83_190950 [compost metagenome]